MDGEEEGEIVLREDAGSGSRGGGAGGFRGRGRGILRGRGGRGGFIPYRGGRGGAFGRGGPIPGSGATPSRQGARSEDRPSQLGPGGPKIPPPTAAASPSVDRKRLHGQVTRSRSPPPNPSTAFRQTVAVPTSASSGLRSSQQTRSADPPRAHQQQVPTIRNRSQPSTSARVVPPPTRARSPQQSSPAHQRALASVAAQSRNRSPPPPTSATPHSTSNTPVTTISSPSVNFSSRGGRLRGGFRGGSRGGFAAPTSSGGSRRSADRPRLSEQDSSMQRKSSFDINQHQRPDDRGRDKDMPVDSLPSTIRKDDSRQIQDDAAKRGRFAYSNDPRPSPQQGTRRPEEDRPNFQNVGEAYSSSRATTFSTHSNDGRSSFNDADRHPPLPRDRDDRPSARVGALSDESFLRSSRGEAVNSSRAPRTRSNSNRRYDNNDSGDRNRENYNTEYRRTSSYDRDGSIPPYDDRYGMRNTPSNDTRSYGLTSSERPARHLNDDRERRYDDDSLGTLGRYQGDERNWRESKPGDRGYDSKTSVASYQSSISRPSSDRRYGQAVPLPSAAKDESSLKQRSDDRDKRMRLDDGEDDRRLPPPGVRSSKEYISSPVPQGYSRSSAALSEQPAFHSGYQTGGSDVRGSYGGSGRGPAPYMRSDRFPPPVPPPPYPPPESAKVEVVPVGIRSRSPPGGVNNRPLRRGRSAGPGPASSSRPGGATVSFDPRETGGVVPPRPHFPSQFSQPAFRGGLQRGSSFHSGPTPRGGMPQPRGAPYSSSFGAASSNASKSGDSAQTQLPPVSKPPAKVAPVEAPLQLPTIKSRFGVRELEQELAAVGSLATLNEKVVSQAITPELATCAKLKHELEAIRAAQFSTALKLADAEMRRALVRFELRQADERLSEIQSSRRLTSLF